MAKLVQYWHGAAPDSFMTHLALSDSSREAGATNVEWGEHVSDDEYGTATSGSQTDSRTTNGSSKPAALN